MLKLEGTVGGGNDLARFATGMTFLLTGGCAIMPDLPPDWALPPRTLFCTPPASFSSRSILLKG
jgi:hypothetical protein